MAGSSTNASGHQGTGIGIHEPGWSHYSAPLKSDARLTHTVFDYRTADAALRAAIATKGSVQLASRVYRRITQYKCTNCNETSPTSPTNYNGCGKSGGRHNWKNVSDWNGGSATTTTLYYDKGGSRIQVSFHAF